MDKGKPNDSVPGEANEAEVAENARREALSRLGVFAAYTSPAMMTLLSTKMAAAQPLTSGATN